MLLASKVGEIALGILQRPSPALELLRVLVVLLVLMLLPRIHVRALLVRIEGIVSGDHGIASGRHIARGSRSREEKRITL
jgi:hypothetical protein